MPDLPVDPDLGKWKFHRAIVENQKNYVKLQIGILINRLNIARILIALVLVLYVDWGSRFVGAVNWCSVVGTGLSGPTLSVL
jgi:hypothetical protein